MSEDVEPRVVKITPTFSAVLNSNLLRLTEALNDGDGLRAYAVFRTVVNMLKAKHQKFLEENGYGRVKELVEIAKKVEDVDDYTGEIARSRAIDNIIGLNMRTLFRTLMLQLHAGHYLENEAVGPKFPSKSKVEW